MSQPQPVFANYCLPVVEWAYHGQARLLPDVDVRKWRIISTIIIIITHANNSNGGKAFTGVCLSVFSTWHLKNQCS